MKTIVTVMKKEIRESLSDKKMWVTFGLPAVIVTAMLFFYSYDQKNGLKIGMLFEDLQMSFLSIIVMFAIFSAGGVVIEMFVGEKEKGTLELLLITQTPTTKILLGKVLSLSAISFCSVAINLVVGSVVAKMCAMEIINFGASSIVMLIAFAMLSIFVSALMSVFGIIAKGFSEGQIAISLLSMLLCAVGFSSAFVLEDIIGALQFVVPYMNIIAVIFNTINGETNYVMALIAFVTSFLYVAFIIRLQVFLLNKEKYTISKN